MAREALTPGTWGSIKASKQADGSHKASGRYKKLSGEIVQRYLYGSSPSTAQRALQDLFLELRDADKAPIGKETPFAQVVEIWIEHAGRDRRRYRPITLYEYSRIAWRDIVPALGHLPISGISILEASLYLHGLIKNGSGYSKAHQNRAVLSQIMGWATGTGLATMNPVRQVTPLPRAEKKEVAIIEPENVSTVLAAVRKYVENPPKSPGPKPNTDVADGVGLFLATGARMSELLALRWEDVDIDGPGPFKVHIRGTIAWEKDRGVLRNEYAKTDDSLRSVTIGANTAASLRDRRSSELRPNPLKAVFPSRAATWLHQANWRRRWRTTSEHLQLGFEIPADANIQAVTPHTFRRTVGTRIAETRGILAAQQQLGHVKSGTTVKYYIKNRHEAPDSSSVLENFMY